MFPEADLSSWLGVSQIVQTLERRLPFVVPVETRLRWWEALGPAIRHDVSPDDPDFEAVFGPMADIARDLEPRTPDWAVVVERELTDDEARGLIWHGRLTDVYLRVVAPDGRHVRRLSSRAYFALIRSLTDLVDAAVIANGGLIGKHAGDGASALFVVDGVDAESDAARGLGRRDLGCGHGKDTRARVGP